MSITSGANAASDLQSAIQHHQAGRLEEAAKIYQQILAQEPDHPDALHLLGVLAYQIGKNPLAVELIGKAITLNPAKPEYYCDLGSALHVLGNLDAAIEHYRTALALKPDYALVHNNLGSALKEKGLIDEAISCYHRSLAYQPDSLLAQNNLAAVLSLKATQLTEARQEALAQNDPASASSPDAATQSDTTSTELAPTDGATRYFAEALRFAQQFEAPLKAQWPKHTNNPDPDKRLKLGYVSGDFRNHAVAYFIEPILLHHDHSKFEIFCYYNSHVQDDVTDRIMSKADHWIPCKSMSEDQLAARILDDGIDILVDLSGHTAHNRLLTFARKPAPVQVTFIGLPATTGLSAMDYRLTENYMDPQGMTEQFYTETLIRLPFGSAYQPPADSPPINALPALTSSHFTLACLNNLAKISPEAITLWARILHTLPNARLMLGNARNADTRQRFIASFAQHGIAAERLILQPAMSLQDYLALHHQIDLALDPFPYNGGTTSYHSLWMGVPVITLAGKSSISRVGVAVLSPIGLTECIADSEDDYIQRTLEYAKDLPRLEALRKSLRSMMQANSNVGPAQFTNCVETAFREMWNRRCAHPHPSKNKEALPQ